MVSLLVPDPMVEKPRSDPVPVHAGLIAALVVVSAVAGIALLNRLGGPNTRCESYGGQMFVGPGGETSCVDGRTFLPVEGFDAAR